MDRTALLMIFFCSVTALPVHARQTGANVTATSSGFIDDCDSAAYRTANPEDCLRQTPRG